MAPYLVRLDVADVPLSLLVAVPDEDARSGAHHDPSHAAHRVRDVLRSDDGQIEKLLFFNVSSLLNRGASNAMYLDNTEVQRTRKVT